MIHIKKFLSFPRERLIIELLPNCNSLYDLYAPKDILYSKLAICGLVLEVEKTRYMDGTHSVADAEASHITASGEDSLRNDFRFLVGGRATCLFISPPIQL